MHIPFNRPPRLRPAPTELEIEIPLFDGGEVADRQAQEAYRRAVNRLAEKDRVIAALHPLFHHCHGRAAVGGCLVEHREEQAFLDVIRTAARDEAATRVEQAQRAQVDFLVAGKRARNRRLVLGERRRIENDGVPQFAVADHLPCPREGIGLCPGDAGLVEVRALPGLGDRLFIEIDTSHVLATR